MAKVTAAASAPASCIYRCSQGEFVLVGGNPPEGTFCANTAGHCLIEGEEIQLPPEPIPVEPPSLVSSVSNSGTYRFNRTTKSLYFCGGSCGKGKHFLPVITAKELKKIDPDAAELVKSMQKNKKIQSFSVTIKAQKIVKS